MDYNQQPPAMPQQATQDYQTDNWQQSTENLGKKGLTFSVLGLLLIWFPVLDIIFWVKGAKKSYNGYKENSGRKEARAGLIITAISAHFYLLFLSILFAYLYALLWGASFAHRLGAF